MSAGRAPTTEEDKKAAEKKREDKAKKKHDRKSKRLDEEEEDNEGGEWERVRGGVPLVKVRTLVLSELGNGSLGERTPTVPPAPWVPVRLGEKLGQEWVSVSLPTVGHVLPRRNQRCLPRELRSPMLLSSRN